MGREITESFRVRGMYFSGTGTTETIVTRIAQRLAGKLIQNQAQRLAGAPSGQTGGEAAFIKEPDIDFTPPAARRRTFRFGEGEIVVFGVPVIAGRVPNVLLPFLSTLEGDGAMAIPIVLYGNRNFDDALIELRNILEDRGFHTVAAAAFIGEHSFSRILAAGRPDAEDLQIADRFAGEAADKIASLIEGAGEEPEEGSGPGGPDKRQTLRDRLERACPVQVDGQEPLRPYYKPRDRQGNHINILKVRPKLDRSKCTGCGICVDVCPMGSIREDAPGLVKGICIKCCGCEKKCPEGALYFDDEGYLYHKKELELGYPDRKEPKLFI